MKPKLIAYYLPQYHPIPENDEWWGKGFTEWTNVAKAKPMFEGHYQPRLPADLGFYDLRVPETREAQAGLAKEYGVYGFCYYHYWFGNGKRLLERPFNEVLASGKPDFPFCLCWANQTWKGVWFGAKKQGVLIEQIYPGKEDYIAHFNELLKAFSDPRYITIDGKPLFQLYQPQDIPNLELFVDTFRECAHKAGFKGIYLMAGFVPLSWNPIANGFDGMVGSEFNTKQYFKAINDYDNIFERAFNNIKFRLVGPPELKVEKRNAPLIIEYEKAIKYLISNKKFPFDFFPCTMHDWDNTPRSDVNGVVLKDSTPALWRKHLRSALDMVSDYESDKKIVFIKSWNEWAEGNYLEPDQKWGKAYLEVIKSELANF
jgi:lipopolysaccharide biosynthesis protein